jgi:hypothetical protein
MFFIRKSLRAKLTAFAVMVLVGFLALTHITIADFDGHQGAGQLNDIWGSVRVDSLEYDGLETYSRHGFWISSWADFAVHYTYEFQHTIRDALGNALFPILEDKYSPPTQTLAAGEDDSDAPRWRSIYVSDDTLDAGTWYTLHAYSRLDVWKKGRPDIRDRWYVEENLLFQAQ